MKYIIFTDLDGTLIDHDTYSYDAARPALELLKEKEIPLIFCTSKTRAELEVYVDELECHHPFISENGGAIFIPKDYFSIELKEGDEIGNYKVIEFGTSYTRIREVLEDIRKNTGFKITGFGDLDAEGVSKDTGLDIQSAKLAKMREYDEAFRLEEDENATAKVIELIHAAGLNHTKGGRYWHIMGDNDKGKAVRALTEIYRQQFTEVTTIALGDSLNDLPMLKAVDIPFLVQKPDGKYDPSIILTEIRHADGIGPVGWNNAIMDLIGKNDDI
ncbi:mannosyl-3-phosphoglycerate phosphatase [Methanococcoides seepicolus]|uniref:Mannosyl-3-phosphoglycerate phosphatase n=1 Tax=Methanococcoides seepicolus TaxID=2828780 RepID=A0A9E5DBA7_9EURY|nr:mannosyl-3-phosphoglycerate phosphatase [Methanococcoides seepicolus]MCM1986727.1 mannosyl-3-phosphoglycerate phosphatase [Methanococcoides seepicolus]